MAEQTVNRVKVDVPVQKDRIRPKEEGVLVNVTNIEFVPGDKVSQTRVTVAEPADENGTVREATFNLPNPYSGQEQYRGSNIGKFLMLFQSLSDVNIKDAEDALGGYPDNHKDLHEAFLGYAGPNYAQVPCNIFLCYPVKDGEASKYLGLPTVGYFIRSAKNPGDLVQFNAAYHSLVPGGGTGSAPEQRSIGGGNTPAKPANARKNF